MLMCSLQSFSQQPSTFGDLQVLTENGNPLSLNDAILSSRNNIVVFVAEGDTANISVLLSWKDRIGLWTAQYGVFVQVIGIGGADNVPASFDRYRDYDLPFRYYVASHDFDSLDVKSLPMALYWSRDKTWQGQGSILDLDQVEDYMKEWNFLNYIQSPFNNNLSQRIYTGGDCATAKTYGATIVSDTLVGDRLFNILSYRDNQYLIRESTDRMQIWRLLSSGEEGLIVDFNANVCDTFYSYATIDETPLRCIVEDKIFVDKRLQLVTDIARSACQVDNSPLTFIRYIGSNSGIVFDVEDNAVPSVLLCHYYSNQIIYRNEIFNGMCNVDFSSARDVQSLDELILYPNPVFDIVTLEGGINGKVTVLSALGKQIDQFVKHENVSVIECGSWPSGIYFIVIENENNRIMKTVIRK